MEKIRNKTNPQIRYLNDLKMVLYDKRWLKTTKNFPVYYIYRGIKKRGSLRYDITEIPSRMLGKEFVKTKGHYHLGNYSELFKILSGEGIFLLQKEKNSKIIEDVYYIKAKKGNYILIPPGYAHTVINSFQKILKIANWISEKCQSNYQKIEKKEGFCYFYTKLGWIKNKNYKIIPKLKVKKPLKNFPKKFKFSL